MSTCPIHAGEPLPCRPCEYDVAESTPTVKPTDPETGERLRHVPLRELVARHKAKMQPTTEEETPS